MGHHLAIGCKNMFKHVQIRADAWHWVTIGAFPYRVEQTLTAARIVGPVFWPPVTPALVSLIQNFCLRTVKSLKFRTLPYPFLLFRFLVIFGYLVNLRGTSRDRLTMSWTIPTVGFFIGSNLLVQKNRSVIKNSARETMGFHGFSPSV